MTYKVIGNVKHNGTVLKKGSMVEFSDEEAKPLLEVGVIADPEAKDKEKVAAGGLTTEERKAKDAARKKKGTKKTDDTETGDDTEDAEDSEDSKDAEESDGLDEMKGPELKELAKKEDVDIKGLRKNADIVVAIRASREDSDDADKL